MKTRSGASVKGTQVVSSDSVSSAEVGSDDWIAAIDEVTRSSAVPRCLKKALSLISRQLNSLLEQKDKEIDELRAENASLRSAIASFESSKQPSDSSVPPARTTPSTESVELQYFESESERRRSIIIGRVPELKNARIRERIAYDFENVCNILNFLGVECYPTAVYRLGRPIDDGDRLLKVVLPYSKFQALAVKRANRLSSFPLKRVYLRPSLTLEERLRRRNSGAQVNPPASPSREVERASSPDSSIRTATHSVSSPVAPLDQCRLLRNS